MMRACAVAFALLLGGCMVGPDYHRPAALVSPVFKEAPPGWTVASPKDAAPKGAWWAIYNDPVLDGLERLVAVSNQNVRTFEAQYRQAQATVDIARAALFPTVGVTASVTRSLRGSSSSTSGVTGFSTGGGRASTIYTAEGTIDWDLDVWGRIRRQVESDVAAAQVSAADLANATLSAQTLLAQDYFAMRGQDSVITLLNDTVAAYADAVRITRNQYDAGTASSADLSAAETQLASAKASLVGAGVTRAQYEHAIAVLTGAAPAALALSASRLPEKVPLPAGTLPATLLERRPDVAAAERAMQEQNALIGVQVAAFYPDISLSSLYGYSGDPLRSLIQTANRVWSLGLTATETLFEGGARTAAVAAQRAAYDASVASYRQTVLTALQQVEDQLSNLRILAQQADAETAAVQAAQRSLQVSLNAYRAGTSVYTAVITQQTALLSAQETALSVQQQRVNASVTLIQALGGGWTANDLPSRESLQDGLPFLK